MASMLNCRDSEPPIFSHQVALGCCTTCTLCPTTRGRHCRATTPPTPNTRTAESGTASTIRGACVCVRACVCACHPLTPDNFDIGTKLRPCSHRLLMTNVCCIQLSSDCHCVHSLSMTIWGQPMTNHIRSRSPDGTDVKVTTP